MINIQTYQIGPLKAFSYLVISDAGNYIIDLGGEDYTQMAKYINSNNLNIDGIIITHGHYDHIIGINKFSKETFFKVPVYISDLDKEFLENTELNLSYDFNGEKFICSKNVEVKTLSNGDKIGPFEVISTPGHTRGSICLINHENKVIFTGDTLFEYGEGRTDLPTGDDFLLVRSIHEISKYLCRGYKLKAGH